MLAKENICVYFLQNIILPAVCRYLICTVYKSFGYRGAINRCSVYIKLFAYKYSKFHAASDENFLFFSIISHILYFCKYKIALFHFSSYIDKTRTT